MKSIILLLTLTLFSCNDSIDQRDQVIEEIESSFQLALKQSYKTSGSRVILKPGSSFLGLAAIETTLLFDENGEVIARELLYLSPIDQSIIDEFFESIHDGNLGDNDQGMEVMNIREIHEYCIELYQNNINDPDKKVRIEFREDGILSRCHVNYQNFSDHPGDGFNSIEFISHLISM